MDFILKVSIPALLVGISISFDMYWVAAYMFSFALFMHLLEIRDEVSTQQKSK